MVVVGESGWAPAVYLRGGIENLFIDLVERPEFAKELMRIGANYHSQLYSLAIAAGADLVFLGDDYCDKNGPMMSPKMFEEIILPNDEAVVSAVKKAGAFCIKHADGDIRRIIDKLVGTGVDGLGPLEDVPGMELDRILDRYPGRITLMGNLSVDLLSRNTVEDVIAATKRLLHTVSVKGPHIMASGNTIASCVRPENYIAMVRTAQELGNTRSANIRDGFAKSADHLALVSATGPAMKIAFMPAVYENAARFTGHTPWEVSRDPELLFTGHRAAYLEYRHRPIAVASTSILSKPKPTARKSNNHPATAFRRCMNRLSPASRKFCNRRLLILSRRDESRWSSPSVDD